MKNMYTTTVPFNNHKGVLCKFKKLNLELKALSLLLLVLSLHHSLLAAERPLHDVENTDEIIIIAADVADADILSQAAKNNRRVYLLEKEESAINQITKIINGYKDLSAVHLMTHGSSGTVHLGDETLSIQSMAMYTNILKEWQKGFTAGGDLLLYGCEIAKGRIGNNFLNELNKVVGLDLAASYDITTSSDKGNWILEKHIGTIETRSLTYNHYNGILQAPPDGLYTFAGATSNGNGTFSTADNFFLIAGNNGSSNASAPDQINADEYGAFMDDGATNTTGTSYLEVRVKNGGSFKVTTAVIGDYEYNGSAATNNFFDIYAVGLVNGVEVARTPTYSSTGIYQTNYNMNFSDFSGKSIDAFRVYFSWNAGTRQLDFNLQDITITGASVISMPTVSSAAASTVGSTSATLGGNVTATGGASVTDRGIVWATASNPTTSNNKVQIGSGTGSYSQSISGLPPNTTIYARAYAINSAGTGYGNQISFTTSSLLPVSLLQFGAVLKREGVYVYWSTASEHNAKDFVIEYSVDGRSWNSIGTIAAAGSSSTINNYDFTHYQASNGTNYYRLLQRDIDGKTTFSKVVKVAVAASSLFTIQNNPVVDGVIRVSMQASETVQIFNSGGALVISKKLQPGIHSLNVPHLPAGVYQFRVGKETKAIVVK